MKKIIQFSFISILLLISSCSKEKVDNSPNEIVPTVTDQINYFIWKGLNTYYLWQKKVPNLADSRFANTNSLYQYFRGFSSPEKVFESLRYQPKVVDRFSWIVNDYVALEKSFQGLTLNNGMEFGLVKNRDNPSKIFGYVRYVIPNSDAAIKKVKRGMIFTAINGTQLTPTNYKNLLFQKTTNYSIDLADYNAGNPTLNHKTISLSKSQLQENPVAITKVFTKGNKKIGYLMYNLFASSYDSQLNAAFGTLKVANIDELIVDLRYNGGGSVKTATYLGSMITGQFTGQIYSIQIWNEKIQAVSNPNDFINRFPDKIIDTDDNGNVILNENINSLHLNRVYFIVSGSTASASELVINSLSSYIDVRLVGTKTVGKQVGSITLYDSDNFSKNGAHLNKNHTYAMQPLVLEIKNKDDKNQPNGFIPSITLPGIEMGENYGNLGVLSESSEPLLSATLRYISAGMDISARTIREKSLEQIYDSKLATPSSNNMYVDLKKTKAKL